MLYQNDTDMLFPSRVIPSLRNARGEDWKSLIEHISDQPETATDVLAFGLMMIRLNACMTCHSDSYRAMRGCTQCARQMVGRFKGTDDELIERWEAARAEIAMYMTTGCPPRVD